MASAYIGLRTCFIDDFLRSEPQTLQTVILGAGLDTRAYRLGWPAASRVLELDHANILEFKAGALEGLSAGPACKLVTVTADLARPWGQAVISGGLNRQQPATLIIEGLLPYLGSYAQLATLNEVTALSPPGSRAVIECAVALPANADVEAKLREFSALTGLPMAELLARTNRPTRSECSKPPAGSARNRVATGPA